MTLRRDRKRGQKKYNPTKTPELNKLYRVCRNCGQPGPHFVPPSGGGRFPGFYMCSKPTETEASNG